MQELNEFPEFTRYKIEHTLGSGGMGTVYLAHHNILSRSVALKVPKRELAQNDIFVERFLREARALGTLNHPHIVTVYDAGIEQGIPYIAMEYVTGDTLANSILNTGQTDILVAIKWGLQMAKALAYLHNRQILHRDLKSANVIIDRAGNAVIADFGIAQIDQDSDLTRGMLGTPSYISPEQARGALLDARSDLYSLGIILYECLTGRLPFRDENSFALIQKVIHETPEDIWNYRPDAPLWLCDLVNKCLEKSPERRFQDGTELASALQQGLPDHSTLMRSEPADTIVSHIGEGDVTIADQYRSKALVSLANAFRPPVRSTNLLPYVDPSPTVTMYGPSQIIQPAKRESRIKAVAKPVSATMLIAFLAILIFIPFNQLPPHTASGQQNTSEVTYPVEGAPLAKLSDSELAPPPTSGKLPVLPPENINKQSTLPDHNAVSPPAGDSLIEELSPSTDAVSVAEIIPPVTTSSNSTTTNDVSLSDPSPADADLPPTITSKNHVGPLVINTVPDEETPASDINVDLSLLEDQLDAQSAFTQTEFFDARLPVSIAALADLKTRTELIKALAAYQSQKILLFGSRSNVKEPDLAYIFLINKDNKKVRSLLVPDVEGWVDIDSGKIVTEEKGRFYEREPNSEVTLKWWLHDVTAIWVELKQQQEMVSRPMPALGKKKRMGW